MKATKEDFNVLSKGIRTACGETYFIETKDYQITKFKLGADGSLWDQSDPETIDKKILYKRVLEARNSLNYLGMVLNK